MIEKEKVCTKNSNKPHDADSIKLTIPDKTINKVYIILVRKLYQSRDILKKPGELFRIHFNGIQKSSN